jgi:hypothetical protein
MSNRLHNRFIRTLPIVTFSRVLELSISHGGEVPSGNLLDVNRRMLFRCETGHEWRTSPYNVLKGSWCPHPDCVGPRISIRRAAATLDNQYQRIHEIVAKRGGRWSEPMYRNNWVPVNLVCEHGHQFAIRPYVLFQGSWCSRCAGKVSAAERLAELRDIAYEHGGELLSHEYKPKKPLQWRCAEGHIWWSSSGSVRDQKSWCPHCAGVAPFDEIELAGRISTLVEQKGGRLISLRKVDRDFGKKEWMAGLRCAASHEWESRVYHLLSGVWCPTCNMPGTREKVCRQVLEHLLKAAFPKRRPDWLRTSKGRKAELDGFNEDLRLAFEYQGQQHFTHVPFFHTGDKSLELRVEDDRLKRETCNAHNITLLEINIDVPLEDLQAHLVDQIATRRPELTPSLNMARFDVSTVRTGKYEDLRKMREIGQSRGGRCLSTTYIDNSTKMQWECSKGHRWFATGASVKVAGSWCPKCKGDRISNSKRIPVEEVETLCWGLSLRMQGAEKKANGMFYLVSCVKGHSWFTDVSRLKVGRGCQKCAARRAGVRLKLTLEQLQDDAAARGGRLLSQRYQLAGVRMLWECSAGHRWLANANSIRRGSWCPVCAGKPGFAFVGSIEEFLRAELVINEYKI